MSRRNTSDQMADDLAAGCFVGMFLALWAAIAGLIIAIFKSGQTSPEEQLRTMGTQQVYGSQIEGLLCPSCDERNEETAVICLHCGRTLIQPRNVSSSLESESMYQIGAFFGKIGSKPSKIRKGKTYMDAEFPIGVGLSIALIFLLVLISGYF